MRQKAIENKVNSLFVCLFLRISFVWDDGKRLVSFFGSKIKRKNVHETFLLKPFSMLSCQWFSIFYSLPS